MDIQRCAGEVHKHLIHVYQAMDKLRRDESEYLDLHTHLENAFFEMEEELIVATRKLEGLILSDQGFQKTE